ncbi:MAG TPA: hypothetical protein VIO16_08440 [Dehalococcoidia bacterium]|jgi:ribosomal protein L37AE/L43A
MALKLKCCPRCTGNSIFREADADGAGWYCLSCGWRETAVASPTLELGARPSHAGWRL